MNREPLESYANTYFIDGVTALREQANQLQHPDEAQQLEASFYAQMQTYSDEDTRAFDVQSIAEDHDVALVSAVRAYGNLGPFRPLNARSFKGVRIFDILLRPLQIVCASSITAGDSSDNLYGNWGIVVGAGTVQTAYPYDATTSVKQGKIFSQFSSRFEGVRPSEQMAHALQARRLYNEINVKMDGLAGIYYCQDEPGGSTSDFPSREFEEVIEPLSIPKYLMRHGQFYPISSPDDIVNQVGATPMPVRELVQQSIVPTKEQTDYMVSYLQGMLTLAPRNAITSGVTRGQFAYDHKEILKQPDTFVAQHERLVIQEDSLSLRLYGTMALHAYSESARQAGDMALADRTSRIAQRHFDEATYKDYKQRILPTGNLAIVESDLRHYIEHESLPSYLEDH
ncbi:MAG: hypothetical protein ACQR33_06775 [Candidatus Saccharibacteria bacterium]